MVEAIRPPHGKGRSRCPPSPRRDSALPRGGAGPQFGSSPTSRANCRSSRCARWGSASVATRSNTFIPTHIQPLRFQSTKNIFIKATCLLLELYRPTHDRPGASRGRERLARGALAQVGVLAAVAIALFHGFASDLCPEIIGGSISEVTGSRRRRSKRLYGLKSVLAENPQKRQAAAHPALPRGRF